MRLRIEDGTVVIELPEQALSALATADHRTLTGNWNTGTPLAGDYLLRGLLYDSEGGLLDEKCLLRPRYHDPGIT